MTTRADIPNAAANIRWVGELLDTHGAEAWDTTIEWDRGIRAQALTGERPGSAGDPTGETVATPRQDPSYHQTMREIIERMNRDANQLTGIIKATNPALTTRPAHRLDETVADDGWCISCHRDDRYCEPMTDHYAGKKLCRWCGDFEGAHGFLPPVDILRDRHQGKRITKQRVEQAIQDHRRASKGKRRKRGRAA